MLQFQVNSQTIDRIDYTEVVNQSQDYLVAKFDFTSDWEDTTRAAQFYDEDENYVCDKALNSDNSCMAPNILLTKDKPMFYVSVVGVDGTKRITTNKFKVKLKRAGYTDVSQVDPSISTQTAYDNFLNAMRSFKNELKTEFTDRLDKLSTDETMHLMCDWIKTDSTDATVYNHEIRTVVCNDGKITLKPYKETDDELFRSTVNDVWEVTSIDGVVYEAEYHFKLTVPTNATYNTITFNNGVISPLELQTKVLEKGKSYLVYLKDNMLIMETDNGTTE